MPFWPSLRLEEKRPEVFTGEAPQSWEEGRTAEVRDSSHKTTRVRLVLHHGQAMARHSYQQLGQMRLRTMLPRVVIRAQIVSRDAGSGLDLQRELGRHAFRLVQPVPDMLLAQAKQLGKAALTASHFYRSF